MELAVITDEIDTDLDRALDVMAEYGIRNAELRTIWGTNIADAPDEVIERAAHSLREHGARAIGLASPFYKCDLPMLTEDALSGIGSLHDARERTFEEQLALLRRCVEIAGVLETNVIRTFTFWRKGMYTSEIEEAIVRAYDAPARIAEESGMTLVVENEHACYTGTGAQTARVLSEIASPNVRAVWDPGNAQRSGETSFPDGYAAIQPFIAHVHVKDVARDGEWTVVGEGVIDWLGQLQALRRDGYSGYLSLETHYAGHGTKEASTRACLVGLQRLLAQV
jgi:sugar phosphate isomerase/epimerase